MAEEKVAEKFTESVKIALTLLKVINPERIRRPIQEDKESIDFIIEQGKKWGNILMEIKQDLELQSVMLRKAGEDADSYLSLARRGIAVFNGKEFKEGIQNAERMLTVLERIKALRDDGFLREIISTITDP